jgi:hypothetical protein
LFWHGDKSETFTNKLKKKTNRTEYGLSWEKSWRIVSTRNELEIFVLQIVWIFSRNIFATWERLKFLNVSILLLEKQIKEIFSVFRGTEVIVFTFSRIVQGCSLHNFQFRRRQSLSCNFLRFHRVLTSTKFVQEQFQWLEFTEKFFKIVNALTTSFTIMSIEWFLTDDPIPRQSYYLLIPLQIRSHLSFHYSLRQQFNDNRKRNERRFFHQITFVMNFIHGDNPKHLAGIYLFFLSTSLTENLIFKLIEFFCFKIAVEFWSEFETSGKINF